MAATWSTEAFAQSGQNEVSLFAGVRSKDGFSTFQVCYCKRGEGLHSAACGSRHERPKPAIRELVRLCAAAFTKRKLEQLRSILTRSLSAMRTKGA